MTLGHSSSHCGSTVVSRLTHSFQAGCVVRLSSHLSSFPLDPTAHQAVSFSLSPCRKLLFFCSVTGNEPFQAPFSGAPCTPRASISTTIFSSSCITNPFVVPFQPFCLFPRPLHFSPSIFPVPQPFFEPSLKENTAKQKQNHTPKQNKTKTNNYQEIHSGSKAVAATVNFLMASWRKYPFLCPLQFLPWHLKSNFPFCHIRCHLSFATCRFFCFLPFSHHLFNSLTQDRRVKGEKGKQRDPWVKSRVR